MFGFVVLHYMAYDMTVECVSTLIQHFGDQNIKIVVVDNASSNGSGKMLASKYQDDCRVEVILNPQNEGFARGNNVGYNYLVVYDNPDYIIVMNNDVLIEQEDFLDRIEQIYQDTSFAVLGPDIYNACSGKHQNPAYLKGFTKGEVRTMYRRAVLGCLFIRVLYWKVNLIKGLRTRNLWRKSRKRTSSSAAWMASCPTGPPTMFCAWRLIWTPSFTSVQLITPPRLRLTLPLVPLRRFWNPAFRKWRTPRMPSLTAFLAR